MMEAWKTARARASAAARSSAAPGRFVSALPSRSDASACCARSKDRLTQPKRGEGFAGRIDYAASGTARAWAWARRRAVVRFSDGTEGEALRWYGAEVLVREGDLIGKDAGAAAVASLPPGLGLASVVANGRQSGDR